jgi:phosphoribosylaminoimidazole carboxylase PurE protein
MGDMKKQHRSREDEMEQAAQVAVIIASDSDLPIMEPAIEILEKFGISYELVLTSAHRSPQRTREYIREAESKGIEVIIAGAGGAAHLPGVIAAETTLPVIGVPIDSGALHGMDSLLAIVQMPGGVPVATMAIGKAGSKNAAIFAAQILARKDPRVAERLVAYKRELEKEVREKAKGLDGKGFKNRSQQPGFKPSPAGGKTDPRR